jgi:superfamily I DNA/RNA helicase
VRDFLFLLNGPPPLIKVLPTTEAEIREVAGWLRGLIAVGMQPHEIAIFVRTKGQLGRPKAAAQQAGLDSTVLDSQIESVQGRVSIGTMHLAKRLEFRAVAVMACDDGVAPLQARIETVSDESDLEDMYNTEWHLLNVAYTRSRDQLLVTSTEPPSGFLDDMGR